MFYSSSSSCGMVFDRNDGYSYSLPKGAKTETLDVCLYKRDDNFNNIPWVRYQLDDTLKYKYSLTSLNGIKEVSISEGFYNPGTWKENLSPFDIDKLEYQYKGTGSYRVIYSKYFPIDESSVELYSININNDLKKDLRELVIRKTTKGIEHADVFFAWLGSDSQLAHGTIAEIGYAAGSLGISRQAYGAHVIQGVEQK